MIRIVAPCVLFVFGSLAFGQSPRQEEARAKPPKMEAPKVAVARSQDPVRAPFVFEIGDWPLTDVIERCAGYLHYNILVDGFELQTAARGRGGRKKSAEPAAVTISLTLPIVTDDKGCEDLLTGLLWKYGLMLVPVDEKKQVYEVLAQDGARGRDARMLAPRRTPDQILARPTLRSMVTTVYLTKHTNAQLANNSLRPFFASVGSNGSSQLMIGNAGNKAALILSGPQCSVAAALEILRESDRPAAAVDDQLRGQFAQLLEQNKALLERVEALERRLSVKGK